MDKPRNSQYYEAVCFYMAKAHLTTVKGQTVELDIQSKFADRPLDCCPAFRHVRYSAETATPNISQDAPQRKTSRSKREAESHIVRHETGKNRGFLHNHRLPGIEDKRFRATIPTEHPLTNSQLAQSVEPQTEQLITSIPKRTE